MPMVMARLETVTSRRGFLNRGPVEVEAEKSGVWMMAGHWWLQQTQAHSGAEVIVSSTIRHRQCGMTSKQAQPFRMLPAKTKNKSAASLGIGTD